MFQFTLNCLVIHSGEESRNQTPLAERLFEAFIQRIAAGVSLRVSLTLLDQNTKLSAFRKGMVSPRVYNL